VYDFWPSEIPWCVAKCLTERWWCYPEKVKSLYCAANNLRGTFAQCSPAVKTFYFVPLACQRASQLWSKYTQTSMKRLRVSCLQQCLLGYALHTQKCKCSSILSGTLMPCLETICMVICNVTHLHLIFNPVTSNVWCFLQIFKIFIFPPLYNAPVWRWPTEVVVFVDQPTDQLNSWPSRPSEVVRCFVVYVYQYCLCVATKTFHVLHGASWFLYFLVIFIAFIAPNIKTMCASQTCKSEYI